MNQKNNQNGKGSKPRPLSVSYEDYGNNYDAIFRKKKCRGVVVNPNFVGKIIIEKP